MSDLPFHHNATCDKFHDYEEPCEDTFPDPPNLVFECTRTQLLTPPHCHIILTHVHCPSWDAVKFPITIIWTQREMTGRPGDHTRFSTGKS